MSNKRRIRLLTVVLFLITGVLIVLYQISLLGGPDALPAGARRKLPTGPMTPMISMAPSHGLIVAGDGSLWAWGTPNNQVLGLGGITNQPFPRRIGSDTNWASISAGQLHNFAIKSDGTMWAWGLNSYGQFGNGTKSRQAFAAPVPAAPGNDWKQAAASGTHHSIGLKKDGTVWTWGYNGAGELGNGTTKESYSPVQVGSEANWIKVFADGGHGAALKSDGSLWVWGVGHSSFTNNPSLGQSNALSPVRISADTNWVDAVFGSGVLMAVKSDGTLWAWGSLAYVYTGAGNSGSNGIPTRVGTNADWQSIQSGTESLNFLGAKKDGTIWSLEGWLRMDNGGFASQRDVRITRLNLPERTISVGQGWGVGVALTGDGELWTWGLVLGERTRAHPMLQGIAGFARKLGRDVHWGDPHPVFRDKPWLLPNVYTNAPAGK